MPETRANPDTPVHPDSPTTHDTVGDAISTQRGAWTFAGEVSDTFVGHIRRSVPGYEEGHALVCQLSDFFCGAGATCYELGTSTGELLRKLAEHHAHKPDVRWIGIDTVREMTEAARRHCAGLDHVDVVCDDVVDHTYEPADLMVSYYTIQFIQPRRRQAIFDRIYSSLNWGGAFIMFEKVRGPDARFQDILSTLYTDYKRGQGFGAEEILAKTDSLKGVLEPFTSAANQDFLRRAGFVDVMPVWRHLCFEGVLAIK